MTTCFRSFFGRNQRHQKSFRNYLTFSIWDLVQKNIWNHLFSKHQAHCGENGDPQFNGNQIQKKNLEGIQNVTANEKKSKEKRGKRKKGK